MNISVVIPVGPLPEHRQWLDECIGSVKEQTLKAAEILIISDMAGLDVFDFEIGTNVYEAPWHLGVATAFNFGVALAQNECVFMLGADDTLDPKCLEHCAKAYEFAKDRRNKTYFYVGVQYMDSDKKQFVICNAAMVTKSLWKHTGGFPIEAFTAPDAALGSIFLRHGEAAGYMCCVNPTKTLYNYRNHPNTDTNSHRAWSEVITQTRHLVTLEWQPPKWLCNV